MRVSEIIKITPIPWGLLEHCIPCNHSSQHGHTCGSTSQVFFKFEDGAGHIGSLKCQECGELKSQLSPRDFVTLASGIVGGQLPVGVSPHE